MGMEAVLPKPGSYQLALRCHISELWNSMVVHMNTERQLFEIAARFVNDIIQVAQALPVPVLVGILCAPVIVAALSRNVVSMGMAAFMSVLSCAALIQPVLHGADTIIPIGAYGGAVLAGWFGHMEARHMRRILAVNREIDQLRLEMQTFLEAVDRRTLAMDQFTRHGAGSSRQEPLDRPRVAQDA
jgi:hypothetical protein